MSKFNKKNISLFTAFIMALGLLASGFVFANDQLDQVNNQKDSVKKEMEFTDAKLEKQEKEVASLQEEMSRMQKDIDKTEAEVKKIKDGIKEIKDKISSRKNDLGKRLRIMYKNGTVGFIDVIFNSKDISEFLSNVTMLQKIYKKDQDTLEELRSAHEKMNAEEERLKTVQEQLKKDKEALDKKRAEAEAKEKELRAEFSKLKVQFDKLASQSAAIEAEIRRAQEEAAAANNQNNGGDSGSQGGGSSSNGGFVPSNGQLSRPVNGPITSGFGYRPSPIPGLPLYNHTGVDFGAPMGTPIRAAADGRVIIAGWSNLGYGNYVVIDHGNGISTLYGHNSSLAVSQGQIVSRGQVIAYCGMTGYATGPHCHFEVRINGTPVNPMGYL